jgi:hypothetical protein
MFLVVIIALIFILPLGGINSQTLSILCISLPVLVLAITLWNRHREKEPASRFRVIKMFSSKKDDGDDAYEQKK